MVLLRPLRMLQRLNEPLSISLHKHTLCSKIDRGSSSLCSSLRGLSSTIQLRIDSSQPARACPRKFHNAAHTNQHIQRKLLNFENWCNGGGVKKCINLTFKVNFLCQKSSESLSISFIEEYQFKSTLFVIDIF